MKVFVVVKHYEYADGFDVVGVYSSRDMADVAISLLSDDEHGEISELETDDLPEPGRRMMFYQCMDMDGMWNIQIMPRTPLYIYLPYAPRLKDVYPTVFVRAGDYEEAKEMAEAEKKYWTEKGVYGCNREHWETIKDQLRVK